MVKQEINFAKATKEELEEIIKLYIKLPEKYKSILFGIAQGMSCANEGIKNE